MARTSPTLTAALAVAASAPEPAESPLTARTRGTLARAIERARADVLAAIERDGATETARRLGVSRSTLALWRAGGWLAARESR